jgi:hypothetical protein
MIAFTVSQTLNDWDKAIGFGASATRSLRRPFASRVSGLCRAPRLRR